MARSRRMQGAARPPLTSHRLATVHIHVRRHLDELGAVLQLALLVAELGARLKVLGGMERGALLFLRRRGALQCVDGLFEVAGLLHGVACRTGSSCTMYVPPSGLRSRGGGMGMWALLELGIVGGAVVGFSPCRAPQRAPGTVQLPPSPA